MRKYAVLLAVFALLGSQPIWATDTGSSATDSLAHEQSLINQANEKLQSKDWRGAQALLKQISEDDGFSLLDDETQHSVFHFLASTAYQNKDDETASASYPAGLQLRTSRGRGLALALFDCRQTP